ncbi:uncharacterized protein LOC142324093 isoform X2 [Lycorma delicatula]|uniref:uncharacterized protein LOC142324093 isoform X2 n=1 Tax=Lycorma delicatula TaxID=130591 RepID=UPI003F50D876
MNSSCNLLLFGINAFNTIEKRFENKSGGFITGVDIFSAEEQEKLSKRAQRFGIEQSEGRALTQKLLKSLYKSMGVTPSDPNIRLDALHMRGTEEMNTQDVFSYFKDYAPASIEWLTNSSCNVMWLDDTSAARALLGLSVKIRNVEQKESKRRRKSIDRGSVEEATMDEDEEESDKNSEDDESDTVSVSDITVPLPPGLWRKGVPHPRSKCVFLRFATSKDRRAPETNKLDQDFSGYIGLISESKKKRFKEQVGGIVFYDTGDEVFEKSCPENPSNPWSAIAYSWGAFDRNKNKIRNESPPKRPTPPPSPVFMNRYNRPAGVRLEIWESKNKRKYNDNERSSDNEDLIKRKKIPRMRMHADDEAVLVEKRLGCTSSKRHKEKSDLRKRLDNREMISIKKEKHDSSKDNSTEEEEEEPQEEVPDLRVAVVTDRSPSPEDNKEDVWRSGGQVKSVLRGARAHDSGSRDDSDGVDDDRKVRSSIRKHRSRSRERHHRSRRRKESSRRHHSRSSSSVLMTDRISDHRRPLSGRSYNEEYDSDEVTIQPDAQDLRAKISKKKRHDHRSKDRTRRERNTGGGGGDKNLSYSTYSGGSSSSKRKDSTFRPKSPLQIEIDNDEYYKLIESD